MFANYPATFQREQGFTEADWRRTLPGAVRDCPIDLTVPGLASVQVGGGTLRLTWQVLSPRQVALMRMPRLAVHYCFDGVSDEQRKAFMRYFDLYTQRGGG